MRRTLAYTFLSCLFLLLTTPALAQSERGAIVGVITDANGAVVPGATVTITNLGTKTTQTLTTNGQGVYEAPFLIPATYEVSAIASGFSKTVNNNVVVNVGQRVSVDLQLAAGSVESNVLIVDTPQLIQTETASIGQVVDNKQLTELPSGDRNIYNFILLNSNVNQPPGGNATAFRLESGGSFSISGTRPSTATFKIDGLSNTDPTFGTPTITPSLDSIQEFQLQNSAYSAEFEGIGQVNVATKSGTSDFHGSLFEFFRNDRLQPRNPVAAPDKSGKPGRGKLRFNQFGGSIGGPIWLPRFGEGGPSLIKGQTFFFFSYEGRRQNSVAPGFTRVLTQAERNGDFSAALGACLTVGGVQVPLRGPNGVPTGGCVRVGQIFDPLTTTNNPLFNPAQAESALNPRMIRQPFANNRIPAERLSQTAQALINIQQPLPNTVSGTNNLVAPAGLISDNNQTSVRIDHQFSSNDSLYGRIAIQDNTRFNKGVLPFTTKNLVGDGRVFNSSWTHVFSPSLINEFRLGYVRGVYGESVDEIDASQFGIQNTILPSLPGLNITGNVPAAYGGFSASVLQTVQNTYQLANNVSWVRGNHSFKFGFKADHNRFKNGELGNGSNGVLTFSGLYTKANSAAQVSSNRDNSLADFLLGIAQTSALATPSIANLRNTPFALYFQDDWKIARRITLNLGLRYEYHQPFREQLLGGARFDPSNGGRLIVANPDVARRSNTPLVVCCTDPQVVEADKMDFGPRIGIAIQPFKSDSTVVRVGYGIFYADSTQFFHWRAYEPLPDRTYNTQTGDFANPGATLANPFPDSAFTQGAGFIPTFGPVPPAILNNQPFIGSGNSGALYNYQTPYSQQWSISIQRELMKNMLLEINYTGSNSKNLPIQWIFSQALPSPIAANNSSSDPAANPFLRRPYPNFNIGAFATTNVLQSNYNAGTIKVDKRFSNGYSFLVTYTYSKSIDQGSEVFALGSTFNIIANNNDFNLDKGLSTFDVPHRFVASGIYEFPFGKGKTFFNQGGWVDKIVGGWRTSVAFQLQSGYPFSPNIRNRRANTGYTLSTERGNLIGDPNWSDEEWQRRLRDWEAGIGGNLFIINPAALSLDYAPGTFGNIPRNAFRAPFGRNLDFSVAKNTTIAEDLRMELRVDVIGATNERLHRFDAASRILANNLLTNVNVGSFPVRSSIFGPRIIQLGMRFIF
jgi:carboxypeptidase family protein